MNLTATEGPQRSLRIGSVLLEARAFIALAIIIVIFASLSDNYLTGTNLITMTRHVAIYAILALGMLLVIISSGIDLSVGSIVGLSGIVAGVLLQGWQIPSLDVTLYPQVWAVIAISLAVGSFVGWVNGFLITRFNVAPFIATLGMMYVARGAALLISNGATFPRLSGSEELGNTGFGFLGTGRILGVPVSIWIMAVLIVVVWSLLRHTPFGRWLYATGGNSRAAQLSGVPVRSVTMAVYMISGFCAAMVGLIIASELTSAAPQAGTTYELNAIAAVVIGGASLAGGRGTVRGAIVGAFVIGFLSDGLVMVGVSTFWQMVIKGAVIVLAVILDQSQQRLKRRNVAAAAAASVKHEPKTGVAPG